MIWPTQLTNIAALLLAAAEGPSSGTGGPAGADSSQSGDGNTGLYFIIGGMVIILFFVMRLRRRTGPPARMSNSSDFEERMATRSDADRLAVDLEETARAVSALLDTKIRVLDRLIRDADERIARLEGSAGPASVRSQAPHTEAEGGGRSAPAAAAPPHPEPEILAHHRRIFELADQGLGVQEIAEKCGHPAGEVELVLSLRKIKRSGQAGS
ncbi:MAG TPA: hypothetical protein PK280_16385 [Planctomycetota bacterium]|nr:hypothetical protein [Planctomycetota bacterium]